MDKYLPCGCSTQSYDGWDKPCSQFQQCDGYDCCDTCAHQNMCHPPDGRWFRRRGEPGLWPTPNNTPEPYSCKLDCSWDLTMNKGWVLIAHRLECPERNTVAHSN